MIKYNITICGGQRNCGRITMAIKYLQQCIHFCATVSDITMNGIGTSRARCNKRQSF
jgi:hypothetical protein